MLTLFQDCFTEPWAGWVHVPLVHIPLAAVLL